MMKIVECDAPPLALTKDCVFADPCFVEGKRMICFVDSVKSARALILQKIRELKVMASKCEDKALLGVLVDLELQVSTAIRPERA